MTKTSRKTKSLWYKVMLMVATATMAGYFCGTFSMLTVARTSFYNIADFILLIMFNVMMFSIFYIFPDKINSHLR